MHALEQSVTTVLSRTCAATLGEKLFRSTRNKAAIVKDVAGQQGRHRLGKPLGAEDKLDGQPRRRTGLSRAPSSRPLSVSQHPAGQDERETVRGSIAGTRVSEPLENGRHTGAPLPAAKGDSPSDPVSRRASAEIERPRCCCTSSSLRAIHLSSHAFNTL